MKETLIQDREELPLEKEEKKLNDIDFGTK